MFEIYTEKARRVIFFALYEASKYGSKYIDTEHLLLGLLRDHQAVKKWFPEVSDVESKIRAEIEKRITRGERISESREMPLSSEGKRVLTLAMKACKKLGHQYVEPEHILIAMFQVESSLAAQILSAQGLNAVPVQELLSKESSQKYETTRLPDPSMTLESFLAGLRSLNAGELINFFATNAEFIDTSGKRWDIEGISKNFQTLFSWYAKKNATYVLESTLVETDELLVALVLWKNMLLASEERAWMHRMSVVLVMEEGDWKIQLVQVTPVQPSLQPPKIT
jgi:Clp amino terminal domain, pathogenicity island component